LPLGVAENLRPTAFPGGKRKGKRDKKGRKKGRSRPLRGEMKEQQSIHSSKGKRRREEISNKCPKEETLCSNAFAQALKGVTTSSPSSSFLSPGKKKKKEGKIKTMSEGGEAPREKRGRKEYNRDSFSDQGTRPKGSPFTLSNARRGGKGKRKIGQTTSEEQSEGRGKWENGNVAALLRARRRLQKERARLAGRLDPVRMKRGKRKKKKIVS